MKFIQKIGNFFRRYRNMRVIILCFLAATTFWFFNALNETYSTSINYPITFDFDRDQYIVVNDLPEEVYLNLQGIGWNLFRNSVGIKVTPLRIYLDNPSEIKAIPGTSLPAFISDQLDEFELNYVLTDSLVINVDRKIERTYKIKIDSNNINLAENHIISSNIHFFPDSVYLMGPASILNNLGDTILLNLPDNNIDEDYNEEVAITFNRNDLIQKSPQTINVVFEVEEIITTQAEVVIERVNFPPGYFLEDSTAEMSVEVRESNIQQLNLNEINVVADFRNFNSNDTTIVPRLRFYPGYIHNIELDSASIGVIINPLEEE